MVIALIEPSRIPARRLLADFIVLIPACGPAVAERRAGHTQGGRIWHVIVPRQNFVGFVTIPPPQPQFSLTRRVKIIGCPDIFAGNGGKLVALTLAIAARSMGGMPDERRMETAIS
jgi:hypothetical protein